MIVRWVLPALLLLVVASSGCVPGPQACPAALLTGVLVEQAGELVVQPEGGGPLERVIWPSGFAVRRDGNRLALVDPTGEVVAHTDDIVRMGGGETESGTWKVCGQLGAGPPAAD